MCGHLIAFIRMHGSRSISDEALRRARPDALPHGDIYRDAMVEGGGVVECGGKRLVCSGL